MDMALNLYNGYGLNLMVIDEFMLMGWLVR
jgi:hypothetical protein